MMNSNDHPTTEEERALRELGAADVEQKMTTWKNALIVAMASLVLNLPAVRDPIKNGVPFLSTNDYYYTAAVAVVLFVLTFTILQKPL